MRLFDNPHGLSKEIVSLRVHKLEPLAETGTYEVKRLDGTTAHYINVESTLTDALLLNLFAAPETPAEAAAINRMTSAVNEAKLASQFKTLTPTQAVNYIENNVTNLATAKDVLKIMARILIAMRDQIWPDLPDQ